VAEEQQGRVADPWNRGRIVFSEVYSSSGPLELTKLVANLVGPDGPMYRLDPTGVARRLGLMYWDRRWHYVTSVRSPTGRTHLDRAIELGSFALRLWDGAGKSLRELAPNEHWVSVSLIDQRVKVAVSAFEGESEILWEFLAWLLHQMPLVGGGAWGGSSPCWVDQEHLERWFDPMLSSTVAGPLWILVVSGDARERLLEVKAQDLAVQVDDAGDNGSLWQLVSRAADMTGDTVRRWADVLDAAHVLPGSPPVRDMVKAYATSPGWRPDVTQWP